jgi:hypothetical protein
MRLRRQPTGGVGQWEPLEHRRIKPAVEVSDRGKCRRKLCVDDWIDENRSLRGGNSKLFF